MKKLLLITVLLVSYISQIAAQEGLTQAHLVSVSPEASSTGISENTIVEIVFDTAIIEDSVNQDTIVLTNVEGTTTLAEDKTLRFTPNEPLPGGDYTVNINPVELDIKDGDVTAYQPKTVFQKFIYWICSLIYANPTECTLCKKVCANSSGAETYVKTEKISYDFSVESPPKVVSVALEIAEHSIGEGNSTTLSVSATLDNNTTLDVTNEVEWILSNSGLVSITNSILQANQEGTATIEAKYKNVTSEAVNFVVYKEINGYKLPPEPDETLNNSTLLGIDSNDNGVRDDVERYIIKKYASDPKYPKTKTAIALQYAWASQKVLEHPTIESKKHIDDALDCQYYWAKKERDKYTQGLSSFEKGLYYSKLKFLTDPELRDHIYNIRERIERKFSFNAALSGNIFDGREESIENCQVDINALGE